MHELDVLFPSPIPVRVGDGMMRVLPLRMRRLGDLLRALGPVQAAFVPGEGLALDALLQTAQAADIICIGLGCGRESLDAMDAGQRGAALLAVVAANQELFFPDRAEDAEPDEHVFSDLVQRLVDAGHRWPDILDYTYAQCRVFDAAAARQGQRDRRNALIVGRAAVASPEVFRQALAETGNG